MCKILTEPIYCDCNPTDKPNAFLGKSTCSKCGNRIKIFLYEFDIEEEEVIPKEIKPRFIEAILKLGSNIVKIKDKEFEVDPKCLNTRHKQNRYPINYPEERIHYSCPSGFESHDNRYRPFKTGLVKGYFNREHKFVIEKNVIANGKTNRL
jgi:hypothetical protein